MSAPTQTPGPVTPKPRRLSFGLPPAPPPDVHAAAPVPEPGPAQVLAGPVVARAAQQSPAPVPATAAVVGEKKPRGRRPRRRAAEQDNVSVYVSAEMREALRRYKANHPGQSYTVIALQALDALSDEQLAQLCQPVVVGGGGRFSGRALVRQQYDDAQVQLTLRPSKADLAVIDELRERCGAPDRSRLIAEALGELLRAP